MKAGSILWGARQALTTGFDWRAALMALLILFLIGYVLSFALANVISGMQHENVEFEVSNTLAPRMIQALRRGDLDAPISGSRLAEIDRHVANAVLGGDIIRVKVWNRRGIIVYSNDHDLIGTSSEGSDLSPRLGQALAGVTVSEVERPTALTHFDDPAPEESIATLETYVPLVFPGDSEAAGAFEIYQDYERAAAQAAVMQRKVTWGLAGGLTMAYVVLMWFVQRRVRVIRRQRDVLASQSHDLERANEALSTSEDRFRSLVVNASDVIVTIDAHESIRYVSPSAKRRWGWPADSLVGQRLVDFVDPESAPQLRETLDAVRATVDTHATAEFSVRTASGETLALQATVTNLLHRASVGGIVLNCRDVTERRRWEQMLTFHAFHDGLTGLPNRTLFMRRLQDIMDGMGDDRALALYLVDLDRFKTVNDSMGHPAGDALLQEAARRLSSALPDATVARLGGDEFAALMTTSGEAEAVAGARAVMEQFETSFRYDGHDAPVSASVGLSLATRSQQRSVSDVVRAADVALYRVKAEGGGAYLVADPALEAAWMHRRMLERDILTAIEHRQLRLLYQPIFALDTGTIVGAEALVRWMHPECGLVLPDEFVPIAESSGAIAQIGRWVRAQAAQQLRAWIDRRAPLDERFRMRVNVSALELCDDGLVESVEATVARYQVPAEMFELEVTESSLVRDVNTVTRCLRGLRRARFHVAIDDFGTGYSSLAYLSGLPVDTLKIDRTFTSEFLENNAARAVVRSVISLAHALGQQVVGEGIESEAQLAGLRELGCELGQGYHLSRPVDARAIERMLEREFTPLRAAS